MEKLKKIIYKAKNILTDQVYIGITTKKLTFRIKDHIQKAKNDLGSKFQNAIKTYGEEVFNWEQIDTATTSNELAEKEQKYILEYKSKISGYNSDRGGGIKKNIYQYDIATGELMSTFFSLSEAAQEIGVDRKTISKACLGDIKNCKGYYWSYFLQENIDAPVDKRKKKVFQFSLKGSYLNCFNSVSEAAKSTGINKSSIAKCCRGEYKYAGEYYWEYEV